MIAAVVSQVNMVTNMTKWVADTYVQIEMPLPHTLLWGMIKLKSILAILEPLRLT
jgi:hypothetical protein